MTNRRKSSDVLYGRPFKVQLFWKGHKNLHHFPHGFDIYIVNVKTIRKMALIFLGFLEKLNCNDVVQKLYEKHSHFTFFKIKTNSKLLGSLTKIWLNSKYVASFYSKRHLLLEYIFVKKIGKYLGSFYDIGYCRLFYWGLSWPKQH